MDPESIYRHFSGLVAHILPFPVAHIAIAVSGGADSMALALLAKRWASEQSVLLTILTVDHGLRPESAREARQVEEWMHQHGIHHVILTWNHSKPTVNLQHEARRIRYQLLTDYCHAHQITSLWLAHHQQDQAETVISRLIRGSGIDGLSAMEPVSYKHQLMIFRPLLSYTPDVLRMLLRHEGQAWIEDPSNQNIQFERVRIRQWLDQSDHKASLIKRLSQTAIHMNRARDFIEQEVHKALGAMVTVTPYGYAMLDRALFCGLHPELGLRVLTHLLRGVRGGVYKPRFEALEGLYRALQASSYQGTTLGGCQFGKPKNGKIFITRELSDVQEAMELPIGKKILWDQRFLCETTGDDCPLTVSKLTPELLRQVEAKGYQWDNALIPKQVIFSLPVIKSLEKVLMIPHIHYYATDSIMHQCEVRFKTSLIIGG